MTDFADDPGSEVERKAKALKVVALVEAAGYLVLLFFWLGLHSGAGVAVTGSLHGVVWLAFSGMVAMIAPDIGWGWRYVVLVIVTGPIGGVLVYERLRREGVSGPYASHSA